MDGWRTNSNKFRYQRFDDAHARSFLEIAATPEALAWYEKVPSAASKADIFRLAWLLRNGGVYIDADEERKDCIERLLPPKAGLVLNWSMAETPCINNWFISSRPSHPLMQVMLKLALENLKFSYEKNLNLSAWLLTGPGPVTMAILDVMCLDFSYSRLQDLVLHSEVDFRSVSSCRTDLEYKKMPGKNWRL